MTRKNKDQDAVESKANDQRGKMNTESEKKVKGLKGEKK